jgi:ubiquinone/menaquinone biosynthesis C-methylase UbiE
MATAETVQSMGRSNACILCHSSIVFSAPELEGYRICKNCDVTWCLLEEAGDPTNDWEKNYYSDGKLLQLHEARKSGIEAIVSRLNAVCPDRGRLLDVGTGLGMLMCVAATHGWSVQGVEPSKIAAEWARKLTGSTVHNGVLEEIKLPEKYYDVVTILDTLRHVPDPLSFLHSARRLLRPGGVMLVREVYRKITRQSPQLKNKVRRLIDRSFSCGPAGHSRRAFYYQCFSPKSLLHVFKIIGLRGWIEPSPVFVEPISAGSLVGSLSRRLIGWSSSAVYHASAERIIISPNLLAFGRAPLDVDSKRTTVSASLPTP